jgi:hypothetical protein
LPLLEVARSGLLEALGAWLLVLLLEVVILEMRSLVSSEGFLYSVGKRSPSMLIVDWWIASSVQLEPRLLPLLGILTASSISSADEE